ncbi:MAG: hypothetical protein U0V45_12800 [Flavobacteriales bacterium]
MSIPVIPRSGRFETPTLRLPDAEVGVVKVDFGASGLMQFNITGNSVLIDDSVRVTPNDFKEAFLRQYWSGLLSDMGVLDWNEDTPLGGAVGEVAARYGWRVNASIPAQDVAQGWLFHVTGTKRLVQWRFQWREFVAHVSGDLLVHVRFGGAGAVGTFAVIGTVAALALMNYHRELLRRQGYELGMSTFFAEAYARVLFFNGVGHYQSWYNSLNERDRRRAGNFIRRGFDAAQGDIRKFGRQQMLNYYGEHIIPFHRHRLAYLQAHIHWAAGCLCEFLRSH